MPLSPRVSSTAPTPPPTSPSTAPPRLVTHIDDRAIAAVGALYSELGVDGEVLDLMSSWVSHFERAPRRLVGLGMNSTELLANRALAGHVVHDLNADPAAAVPGRLLRRRRLLRVDRLPGASRSRCSGRWRGCCARAGGSW